MVTMLVAGEETTQVLSAGLFSLPHGASDHLN